VALALPVVLIFLGLEFSPVPRGRQPGGWGGAALFAILLLAAAWFFRTPRPAPFPAPDAGGLAEQVHKNAAPTGVCQPPCINTPVCLP